MATYFFRAKHISRGKGARATKAAAYRAGERIRDERTSEVYDYSDRRDIPYKEVVVPSDLAGRADMAWTQDRTTLWNAVEYAGTRRNSRLAREYLVFLPSELTPEQRIHLVRKFAAELANNYRCAIDATIHQPRPGADPRNHHAHLMTTTREVSPDGIGARTTLELGGRERLLRGLGPARDEYVSIRERWAQLTNEALKEAALAVHVDHRSLKSQGIDREPVPTIPEKVFYAERKKGHSASGDEIRARHRERVEARLKSADELERVVAQQQTRLKDRAREDFKRKEADPKQVHWGSLTRAERNELRREQYKARREIERQDPAAEARRRAGRRQEYRDSYQRNPDAVRERRNRWRRSHADEVNRKQREYRRENAEELNRKRRELCREAAQQTPTQSRGMTAEEAARRWKAYRQSQPPTPTTEESARKWKALRESQKLVDSAKPVTTTTHDNSPKQPATDAEELTRKPPRSHDLDFEM
jgi:hypothetical protein